MSIIIRKNVNLKILRQFEVFYRSINRDFCFTNRSAIRTVTRWTHNHFATVANKYSHNAAKINSEFENTITATTTDLDSALSDLDFSIRQTGRSTKKCVENVLSMIEKNAFATDAHGLLLLRSCAVMYGEKPVERCKLALRIWEKILEVNCQIDVRHYNSLLKVFTSCNHEFSALDFLTSMDNSKVEPNKITYLLLMQTFCKQGDLNGASEILQCLKEKGIAINVSVFNLLIIGHMKANDFLGAKELLEVMKSSGLSPNAESYANLACGYAANGNVEGLKSTLQDAKENHIVFSNEDFLSLITSLSSAVNSGLVNELTEMLQNIHDWRPEIMNAVMELIHKGSDESAFTLLLTVANPKNSCANDFVIQLIKCETSVDKVVEYCKKILDAGIHNYIFMNAQKAALEFHNIDLLFALFEAMIDKGISVRTHDFQPIFFYHKNMEESIWLTLKKMFQFGVPSDFATYTNCIYPAVSTANLETLISNLQETGQSLATAIDPLFQYYCYDGQFENAHCLTEKYPVCIHVNFSLERYASLYNHGVTNQKAYLKVLNFLLRNLGLSAYNAKIIYGRNLAELIQLSPSLFKTLYLKHNELFGYSLPNENMEICADMLRLYNPRLLSYLQKIKSSENMPNMKPRPMIEKNKLNLIEEKNLPVHKYLLDDLFLHLRNPENISKINELKEELDKLKIQYPPLLLSRLLYFYCNISNLEQAKQTLGILKENYPTFEINSVNIIDYANLLIKFSKLDEAIDVIRNECKSPSSFDKQEFVLRRIKNVLNVASDTGNIEFVQNLLHSLSPFSKNFKSNIFYEPLIKVHLRLNDLDSAIEEFEKCVKNYQVAPCLRTLMKRCIMSGNHEKLEIVIKAAASLNNKEIVLWELIQTFLKVNKKSEALKVLQSMRNNHYLEKYCTQLYNQGKIYDLLECITLICSGENIDKEQIVSFVLNLIDEKNDFKTALDIYSATKNLLELKDKTKHLFFNLLTRNKQQVPFDVSGSILSKDFVISA
ncbi:leucine-rich PPR motif-containing protein, mitochondrial [Nephila pilipes]|uniref:Leucine-rich PPR motif-containing protein, mitochondrial n=1 Tax=Nephila pilipes TaxID=299642 RepID=A0A8X6TCX8_NEPPI|nr:leucine-rich PPR motif-containing protein, mitochondrial [Nephila pilipes]